MIDWFVLLVPFAVLPVILVFGFVGCVLETEGIPQRPTSAIRQVFRYLSGPSRPWRCSNGGLPGQMAQRSRTQLTRTAVTPPPPPAHDHETDG